MIVSPPRFVVAAVILATPALALDRGPATQTLEQLKAPSAAIPGHLSAETVQTPTANVGMLRMVNGLSPLDTTYASVPNPNAIMLGVGNSVSFCPAGSCVHGPNDGSSVPAFSDHQRASLLVSSQTQDDGHSQESTLALTTTVKTGYAPIRQNGTAYAAGANITVGNAVYRTAAGGTTGTTAPPGIRPATLPFHYKDGSVVWTWINDAAINAKVGASIEARTLTSSGKVPSWT